MSEHTSNLELPPKLQLYKIADTIYKNGVEETLNMLETRSDFDNDKQAAQYKRLLSEIKSGRERDEVWLDESSDRFSFQGSTQVSIGEVERRENGIYKIGIYDLSSPYTTDNHFDFSKLPHFEELYPLYHDTEMAEIIISPEYPPYLIPLVGDGYVKKLKELGEEPPFISDDEAMVLLDHLKNPVIDLDTTISFWDDDYYRE